MRKDNNLTKQIKFLWEKWKKIAYAIGKFNSKIILTVIYFILLWPFVIIAKAKIFFSKKKVNSNWQKTESYTKTISDAKEQ